MSKWDKKYIELCEEILETGTRVENRTGIDTIKIPFKSFEFDLEEEFPILTTKFVAFKSAVLELFWFYQAKSNDVRWLKEYANTIGTAYGYIVNKFNLTDNLIKKIKENPTDRRMIMSLWQDDYLKTAVLPSCVWNSMWDVTDGKLNAIVTCRSNDVPLGMPFNVTQYAVLVHLLAHVTGLKPGKLYYNAKDVHIYVNQIDGIKEQIKRYHEKGDFEAPKLWINPEVDDFFKFDNSKELKDIKLIDYKHHEKISMPVAV